MENINKNQVICKAIRAYYSFKTVDGKVNKNYKENLFIGILALIILISSAFYFFPVNLLDQEKDTDQEQHPINNDEKNSKIFPRSAALSVENLTVTSGEELYENQNYWFNGSFYDTANKTKEFTTAYLETRLIGDDSTFNDSITPVNNSETQFGNNHTINIINGTQNYQNGTLNATDGNYITFQSTVNGTYSATYSFTGETGNTGTGISFIDTDSSDASCTGEVIESYKNHRDVIDFYDNNGAGSLFMYHDFPSEQGFGSVEFYIAGNDNTNDFRIYFRNDIADNVLRIRFDADQFYVDNGGWVSIINPIIDATWYHMRIDWRKTGASVYQGLAEGKWQIIVDGTTYGSYDLTTDDGIKQAEFRSVDLDTNYHYYLDAWGESWDPSYTIGDNKYPVNATLNFTVPIQFQNFNKDLLALEISSYYNTSNLQLVNFSLWDFVQEKWILINSSANNDGHSYRSYYLNSTNDISNFFNASGHIRLNYVCINSTDNFSMYLDFLQVKIFYKLELGIQKSFNIKGNWKYCFHLVGSDYYSDWIYFEVIEFIDGYNNFENLVINSITNIKRLEDWNFSEIIIDGYLNCTDTKKYLLKFNYIIFNYTWDFRDATDYLSNRYEHPNLMLLNNGTFLSFSEIDVYGGSYFRIDGILRKSALHGSIMPYGDIPNSPSYPLKIDQNYQINFSIFPYVNTSNEKTFLFSTGNSNFITDYQIDSQQQSNVFLENPNLKYYLVCNTYSNEDIRYFQITEDLIDFPFTFPEGNFLSFFHYFDCLRGLRIKKDTLDKVFQKYSSPTLININFSKDITYLFPNYSELLNGHYEIQKHIRLFSRNEQISAERFQFELVFNQTANPTGFMYKYNLTSDTFYSYPYLYNQSFQGSYPDTSINVYYENERILNYAFNFYSFEQNIDITIPERFKEKQIYFGIYNFDGFGLEPYLLKFYINNSRKDFGFNTLLGKYANLQIKDFWNFIIYNRTIQINSTLYEFNIEVQLYTLILNNNYSHSIRVEIYRVGYSGNITQVIPSQTGLFFRFYPNVQYRIKVYYINGTKIQEKTIVLDENNKLVNFGFYEEPITELPEAPSDAEVITNIIIILIILGIIIAIIGYTLLLYKKRNERLESQIYEKPEKKETHAREIEKRHKLFKLS